MEDEWEDYTNASAWEELQHDVEEILIHWGLKNKGVVTHLDDDDEDIKKGTTHHSNNDPPPQGSDSTPPNTNSTNPHPDNPHNYTTDSGTMAGIQGGEIHWRAREWSVGGESTHNRLPPTTYRLTLYYGNVKAGLPRWTPGQEHLTPTMLSMLDTRQDFQLGRPFVHRIFGLSHFLIFCDVNDDTRPPNQLLSVVSVALNQCNCTLPVFVPVQERTRKYYVGLSVPGSRGAITIRYESDEAHNNPNPLLTHLSGLSTFLKRKVRRCLSQRSGGGGGGGGGGGKGSMGSGGDNGHTEQRMELDITHAVRWIWTGRTKKEHDDEWRRPFFMFSTPPSLLDVYLSRDNAAMFVKRDQQRRQRRRRRRQRRRQSHHSHHSDHSDYSDGSSSDGNSEDDQDREDDDDFSRATFSSMYMDREYWGPCCDPLNQCWIFATWPKFPEGAFVETEEYTSLNCDQAPEWYVRCHPNKNINMDSLHNDAATTGGGGGSGDGGINMATTHQIRMVRTPDKEHTPWTFMLHSMVALWKDQVHEENNNSDGDRERKRNCLSYVRFSKEDEEELEETEEENTDQEEFFDAKRILHRVQRWMNACQLDHDTTPHAPTPASRSLLQSRPTLSSFEVCHLLTELFCPSLLATRSGQKEYNTDDEEEKNKETYTAPRQGSLPMLLSIRLAALASSRGLGCFATGWCVHSLCVVIGLFN